jgi:hypothetical protein
MGRRVLAEDGSHSEQCHHGGGEYWPRHLAELLDWLREVRPIGRLQNCKQRSTGSRLRKGRSERSASSLKASTTQEHLA